MLMLAASSAVAQCYLPEDGPPERSKQAEQSKQVEQARLAAAAPSRAQLSMVVKVRNSLQRAVSTPIPVFICQSPKVNAIATQQDVVIIFSGLLAIIGENENAASMILGHEFAHVVDRHIEYDAAHEERIDSEALRAQYGSSSAGASVVLAKVESWANAAKLKYKRDLEYLADERGLQFAIAAGFNPWSAIKIYIDFLSFEDKQEDTQSDHPLTTRRIARLWQLYEDELKRGKRVEQAKDQAPENEMYKARVDELLARRRWGEAATLIGAWLVAMPESGWAWFYRGTTIRRQRLDDVRGIEAFEKAVTYDPENRKLWLTFCVAMDKYDHRLDSAHCSRFLKYGEDRDEHADKVFDGRLFVGGLPPKPPRSLLVARDEDGKKLITNDVGTLRARGLAGESVAPWGMLRRPR